MSDLRMRIFIVHNHLYVKWLCFEAGQLGAHRPLPRFTVCASADHEKIKFKIKKSKLSSETHKKGAF